jgi:hypothetical protein
VIFKKEKKKRTELRLLESHVKGLAGAQLAKFQTKFTAFSVVVQSIKESVLLDKHTDKVEGTNIT